jgi:anti-sigma-K factor RskA
MDQTKYKDYVFGELTAAERRAVEAEAKESQAVREEIARLQLLKDSLGTLRDQEMPRRIAFVSDPVFEQTWWQKIWRSTPQLGFVSAGLLAGAIVLHGWMLRPAAAPLVAQAPLVSTAEMDARIQKEVSTRLDSAVREAVTKAVADIESRRDEQTKMLLAAERKHFEETRREDLAAAGANIDLLQKQVMRMYAASNAAPGLSQ